MRVELSVDECFIFLSVQDLAVNFSYEKWHTATIPLIKDDFIEINIATQQIERTKLI